MPTQDTSETKERIISFLRRRGPSLPIHIAKEIETNTLFTSAFLSELISDKRVKMSYMRVGNSPVYFLSGQENSLERFSNYLRSKEKDAFLILKEKKILRDSEQEPAIRVALREIKDFAIPFKKDEELFWKFQGVQESDFLQNKIISEKEVEVQEDFKKNTEDSNKEIVKIQEKEIPLKEKTLDIFGKENLRKPKKTRKKIISQKKNIQKQNKLLEKVKNFLSEKSTEIVEIIGLGKNEIILKIKEKNENSEKILIAYNKRRVDEKDVIKASKKSSEYGLSYTILSHGEPLKKITDLIEASKNLFSFEKLK